MTDYTLSNIKAYLVGNFRYAIYHSTYFKWLIRKHIKSQIEFRIKYMNPVCYNQGSCEICGCKTTALQMSDKACDNPCYPSMMLDREWWMFLRGGLYYDRELKIFWKLNKKKLNKFKTYQEYVGNISY